MLSNTDRLIQYDLSYPFDSNYEIDFKYWEKAQITAVLSFDDGSADETLVLDSDYSLTDPDDTGTLTKLSDWDHDAVRLTIYRTVALTQETDYRNGEAVDMDIIEQDFDLAVARDQQIDETISRSVVWPITDPAGISNALPAQSVRANKFAAWDAEGAWAAAAGVSEVPVTESWAAVLDDATIADGLTTMGFSAFIQTLIEDADAAAALTTLGFSAFIQTLIDDVDAEGARETLGITRETLGITEKEILMMGGQVGSGLSIAGIAYPSLAALSDTDVAFIDDTLESLRRYKPEREETFFVPA